MNIKTLVSKEMNLELTKLSSLVEIQVALNQMGPLKSPSLNDFNVGFFQTYWHIVGPNVSLAGPNFLNKGINYTFLVLIPKIKNLFAASDYRPISLCNVVYKLVSQTLANWLK